MEEKRQQGPRVKEVPVGGGGHSMLSGEQHGKIKIPEKGKV